MKKTNKFLILAASLLLVVGCGNPSTGSSSEPAGESSSTQVNEVFKDQIAVLDSIVDELNTSVTADFKLPAILDSLDGTLNVTYQVVVAEGGSANVISVGATENNFTTFEVEVTNAEVATSFQIVATITDGTQTVSKTYEGFVVPKFEPKTVAEWLAAKDEKNAYIMQGVITAVKDTTQASSFTFTDATGTVFSYDNPSVAVNVGDEVLLSSIYSEYSGGFPQLKSPTIIAVKGQNQLDKVASQLEEIDINTIKENLANYVAEPTSISTKYIKIKNAYIHKNGDYATLTHEAWNSSYCVSVYYHSDDEMLTHEGAKVDVIGAVRGVGSSYITVQVQSYEITADPVAPETKYDEPAHISTTVKDLVTTKPTEDAKVIYEVEGTWTAKDGMAPESNKYGNGFISDAEGNQITIYGLSSTAEAVTWSETAGNYTYSNKQDFPTLNINDGDTVKVGMVYTVKFDNYSSYLISHTPATGETPDVPDVPEVNPNVLNVSNLENGDITADATHGNFTIKATSDKKVTVEDNEKIVNDVTYTKRLKLNGKSEDPTYRNITFTTEGAATLNVVAISGSSSATRPLVLHNEAGEVVQSIDVAGDTAYLLTYNVPAAGTYWLASGDSGINLYCLELVAATGGETPENPEQTGTVYTLAFPACDTSTNMQAGTDHAADLGLDADKFSVTGANNGNNNYPGLNKIGEIRMYSGNDGSNGEGNSITVTAKEGTIVSFTVTFSSGYDGEYLEVTTADGTVVTAADGVYTVNSSSFTMKNVNPAKSKQIRFTAIAITVA